MKNHLCILLLFLAIPFTGLAHPDSYRGDSIVNNVNTKPAFKNKITLDVELLLAANFSYKRRVAKKFSIGVTVGGGFPIGFPWNSSDELERASILSEFFRVGLILTYEISKKMYYEISPQYIRLASSFDGEIFLSHNGLGIKNGVFYKWKKLEIGVNIFIGKLNIGYNENSYENYSWKWVFSNSFIIVKIPLQQW